MALLGGVIDFEKAQKAGEAISDNLSREIVKEILPVVQATVSAVVNAAQDRLDASVGDALKAVTAERMEIVNDVHALLDRLNGTRAVMTEGGFVLQIPPRKGSFE